jgi:type IV pilus assembly protein PilF
VNVRLLRSVIISAVVAWGVTGCQQGSIVSKEGEKTVATEPRSDSRLAEINTQLGVEYMKEGNYEVALKKLKKAIDIDAGYARAYDVLGLLYVQLGENNNATQSFKRALELAPNDSNILNNYGLFLCRQGDPKQAQELFAKAVQNPLYQTPEVAYTNAGLCALDQQKDRESARKFLRQALEKNPEMPVALLQMSRLTFDDKQYMAARGYFERYAQVGKHTSASLWLGVQIEQQLGNTDAADSYAMTLKGKFPDSQEAQRLMKNEQ